MTSDVLGLIGSVLDTRYRIDGVVGEGGYGVVYRGMHLRLKRKIAVKCLKIPDQVAEDTFLRQQFIDGFRKEGEVLARLNDARSPALVQVHDYGVTQTRAGTTAPYLVLEWLEGRDLEAVLEERRQRALGAFSELEALQLLRPAVEAIAYAHAHRPSIVHRDLKPSNLFLVDSGLKVLDFGIAKVMELGLTATRAQTHATALNQRFSPVYGAPEQFMPGPQGFGATGPWTDVHALGLILVELVTGRCALDSDSDNQHAYCASAVSEHRPTPRARGADVPVSDELEALCERALALRPRERFPNAGAMLQALDAVLIALHERSVRTHRELLHRLRITPHWPAAWMLVGSLISILLIVIFLALSKISSTSSISSPPSPCETGDAQACNALGVMVEQGNTVKKDHNRALKLFKQACDKGSAVACDNLGAMLVEGKGVPKDVHRALELFSQGCEGGDPRGCTSLGRMYANRIGVARDDSLAIQLFTRGCNGGDARGCTFLAFMHEAGTGVVKDNRQAVKFFTQGCSGGVADACVMLGLMYANGRGVTPDVDQSVRFYTQGCEGGHAIGCVQLGLMYARGLGVAHDPHRAIQLFGQGCEAGDKRGCTFSQEIAQSTR